MKNHNNNKTQSSKGKVNNRFFSTKKSVCVGTILTLGILLAGCGDSSNDQKEISIDKQSEVKQENVQSEKISSAEYQEKVEILSKEVMGMHDDLTNHFEGYGLIKEWYSDYDVLMEDLHVAYQKINNMDVPEKYKEIHPLLVESAMSYVKVNRINEEAGKHVALGNSENEELRQQIKEELNNATEKMKDYNEALSKLAK